MWRRPVSSLMKSRPSHWSRSFTALKSRRIDSVYVTSNDVYAKSSPIILGMMNALEAKYESVGYFRPIAPSLIENNRDHHLELMQHEFKLTDNLEELYGVHKDEAIRAWLSGKEDDMIDEILNKFDSLKQKHDFIVIEGTNFESSDANMPWELNVQIAKAIGAPVIMTTDMNDVPLDEIEEPFDELITRVLVGKELVEDSGLRYAGTIANRVHCHDAAILAESVRTELMKQDVPFLGLLPFDGILGSKRLNEVMSKLNARQLYGNAALANTVVVTDGLVATSELRELFAHMKKKNEGLLVIASADRTDVMLGLLVSRLSGALPNVSGIVLTNGQFPQDHVKDVLEGIAKLDINNLSIPIYTVLEDSYQTANKLSRISCDILPTSRRKIDQSYTLFDKYIAKDLLLGEMDQQIQVRRTPKQFKHYMLNKAKAANKHIVLTEGEDDRILHAADELLRRQIAKITILGDIESIKQRASALNLDLSTAQLINPLHSEELATKYADKYYELRKMKGINLDFAKESVLDATYFGTMMVAMGDADGMVSGACHTTANTIRPALQLIKTRKDTSLVSSIFFMCLEDDVRIYGDCAVNTDPTAEELAQIAICSAESAQAFGMVPRVALLSYATGDSNKGPIIDKVRKAKKIAQALRPDIAIYGPIQYDAAVDVSIAKQKLKTSPEGIVVGGHANVLVFPDLNTGNNTYKAVQQSTQCIAMGPMLQGLQRPVNDLSRGATVADIVTTVAITAIQAEKIDQVKQ